MYPCMYNYSDKYSIIIYFAIDELHLCVPKVKTGTSVLL